MFEPVKIQWGKKAYEVPGDGVMALIDAIEREVTIDDLYQMQTTGAIRRMQVARGYAAAVNHAIQVGGYEDDAVSPEDIYRKLFSEAEAMPMMANVLYGLMALLIPPESLIDAPAQGKKKARGGSSKRGSKSRSSAAGRRRTRSGD